MKILFYIFHWQTTLGNISTYFLRHVWDTWTFFCEFLLGERPEAMWMRESEAKTNSIKLEFYTITVEFPYRSVSENFPLEKRYIEITVCIQSAKIIAWLFSPNRHKGDTISKSYSIRCFTIKRLSYPPKLWLSPFNQVGKLAFSRILRISHNIEIYRPYSQKNSQ